MSSATKSTGFIALMAVLIAGAACVAIATALLTVGTDLQRSSLVYEQSSQARSIATACAEEGLQKIRENISFTGTNTLTFTAGNCTYVVTNVSGSMTILATGTVQDVVRKVRVYATIASQSISITSWQEIE